MKNVSEKVIRNETCLEFVKEKISHIERDELPKKVSYSRFLPVEKIVYALVSLILIGVATAVLNLVLKK